MKIERFQELRNQFSRQRLVVVGDVMLDTYYWGNVSRISPEAPVPIVAIEEVDHRPGGAANVAYNLHCLGAEVLLIGLAGRDSAGKQLEETLGKYGIRANLAHDKARPTTEKMRVIAGSQHVVRLDREATAPLSEGLVKDIYQSAAKELAQSQGLILQDYNKGVLSVELIEKLKDQAKKLDIPVFVDPKTANLESYRGATLIKPNIREAEHFVRRSLSTDDEIRGAGEELRERLQAEVVLITRGSRGMDLFDRQGSHRIPTRARKVADVCGAGDTVLSTYTLALVAGAEPGEAADLANFAAGSVVEEMGIVPVTPERLEGLLNHHASQ
ncbi:D-glycero-beta-D-manno-heptose-7-phosphate kinase [Candidatus Neomarinimicrobiota bacterium]